MYEQLLEYVRANDLPTTALVMEEVQNVYTIDTTGDKSKPVKVAFRVLGEIDKVKKTRSSVVTLIEKGTLHRRLIAYDSRWFDAKIELDSEIKVVAKYNVSAIVVGCVVGVVVVVVVIVIAVWMVRKSQKKEKVVSVDVEKASEESYSEDYSGYSYSEETESE